MPTNSDGYLPSGMGNWPGTSDYTPWTMGKMGKMGKRSYDEQTKALFQIPEDGEWHKIPSQGFILSANPPKELWAKKVKDEPYYSLTTERTE